ncbi:MAG: type II secretion system protein N [Desulfatiglans sp.]|jgi:general secretion pathway protein C|nr:type II secretion system protein N [Thermodesulfobacteriota bacterium]MEE4352893.1 type II secretion system protein N [Desulfatiglans sp.]
MTKFYYPILNFIALTVIIVAGVDIFYAIISYNLRDFDNKEIVRQQIPVVKKEKKRSLNDYKVIVERNFFDSSVSSLNVEPKKEDVEALEPTSLRILLFGTVTGNKENAFAVIEETDTKKQGLYRVGDSIQNAIVKHILRGKVVLTVGDKNEILTMEESAASRPEKGSPSVRQTGRSGTITVKRSDIEASFKNFNQLLTQVRVRPHFEGGRPDGFSVSQIKRGSIFSKLGLRNGDIIRKIDGRTISGPDDALSLYEKLESGDPVSVELTRRNRPRTIHYKFR